MNTRNPFHFFSLSLALLIAFSLGVSMLSGCGAAAASKKQKSKKSQVKHDQDDEEQDNESHEKAETKKDSKSHDDEHEADKSDKDRQKSEHKSATEKVKIPSADAVWADLIKGNQRFMAGKHSNGQFIAARQKLSKGQQPQTIILGCADSRVPPEMVFDKNLGDLFVVRAAGNIADAVELGSIEYAIEHLHASVLIVLGHESCGAVAAALSDEEMPSKNLTAIVSRIAPAFENSQTCPMKSKINLSCVELNVHQSAKDILSNSPLIEKAIEEKRLTVIEAVYRLESGEVQRLS